MRRHRRHLQRHLPRLGADAPGAKNRGARQGAGELSTGARPVGEKQPQLQFTTTAQIAGLATFLASDTASNMQGTQLVSDGGWVAQ